ncbi:NAD(P)/FAD-dependent oxidoreductase [Amycolatopsis sp. DSM 110486]|uniref:NAD(P)/FAD-dependent oxidoreductase n=1 Tax=Amycolatopsis sp. DSM 110486 TaxID=2865832 RepID=UPI001C69B060|nr:FAD-dependent oxidoreductase [Amycolatopsis sp. DSM 110486]QYN23244.1 FAD-dependent oxidoreductase [Amycolatopsis sp. DSM 110486]
MSRILIVGGGFAGVWSAASAVKLRQERGLSEKDLQVTVVNAGDDMVIRPRLYEADPDRMRVPLDRVLGPIGVRRVAGTVVGIDTDARTVSAVRRDGTTATLGYDRLVLASGSQVVRPALPGAEHLFDIDTLAGAATLDSHLRRLPDREAGPGRFTAVVVGAGFTGLEIATELVGRLKELADDVRVVLVERLDAVGPELGEGPRPAIEKALADLGVEVRLGVSLEELAHDKVRLSDGTVIPTSTVVWTAGMTASPLTSFIAAEKDHLGRLDVDEYLRVRGVPDVYAAGDTAAALSPAEGRVVMQSCQHALPQGKFAGHNVAADLLDEALVRFEPAPYVTCLSLGPAGAVVTSGWDREVQMTEHIAKDLKHTINEQWIYPPVDDPAELLNQAGPYAAWPEYEPAGTVESLAV